MYLYSVQGKSNLRQQPIPHGGVVAVGIYLHVSSTEQLCGQEHDSSVSTVA